MFSFLLKPHRKKVEEYGRMLEVPTEQVENIKRLSDEAARRAIKEEKKIQWEEQKRMIKSGVLKGHVCTGVLRDTTTGEAIGYMLQKGRDPNNTMLVMVQNDKNGKQSLQMLTRNDATGKFSFKQKGKPYYENGSALRKKTDALVMSAVSYNYAIDFLRQYYLEKNQQRNQEFQKQQQPEVSKDSVNKAVESPKMDSTDKEKNTGVVVGALTFGAGMGFAEQIKQSGVSYYLSPPSADVTEGKSLV